MITKPHIKCKKINFKYKKKTVLFKYKSCLPHLVRINAATFVHIDRPNTCTHLDKQYFWALGDLNMNSLSGRTGLEFHGNTSNYLWRRNCIRFGKKSLTFSSKDYVQLNCWWQRLHLKENIELVSRG